MMTLSGPSCATSQVPTIGSNVAGACRPAPCSDRSLMLRGQTRGRRRAHDCSQHVVSSRSSSKRRKPRPRSEPATLRRIPLPRRRRYGQRMPAEDLFSRSAAGVSSPPPRKCPPARPPPSSPGSSSSGRPARTRSRRRLAGLLEDPDRGRGDVVDLHAGHHPAQLRQRARSRSTRRGILGREMRLDPQRLANRAPAPLRPAPETSCRGSRKCPSSRVTNEHASDDRSRGGERAPATRRRGADRDAEPHPEAREYKAGGISASAISTTSRRTRPCWNSATIAVGV